MEIERKFLVKQLPTNLAQYKKKEISQSYISTSPTIRIRKSNSDYILTVKGKSENLKNEVFATEEFELPLSKQQFHNLLNKTEGNTVEKTRHLIPIHNNLVAELDIYHKQLKPLITVEVEFETLEEAKSFSPPSWFGEDVSHLKKYSNSSLSKVIQK